MPLAVELAAARVKLLPPGSLLARLEHALPVLVGGARDLPQRQQTLRGTIAWSYGLLGAGAGRLLAACSVFRGGISLESAESVCAAAIDLGIEVLDGLEELVDQSLLRRIEGVEGPGGPRFGMLFMVREYAAERLAEMPERARVEEATPPRSWPWPKRPRGSCAAPASWSGLTGSRPSTRTSARPSTGTPSTSPAMRCAWPWRCPVSGGSAVTSPRGAGG